MEVKGKKLVAGMAAFSLVLSSCITSVMAEPITSTALSKNRIFGADRYETAVEISKSGWTTSDYVVLASGQDYADALCAVPLAKKYGAPVLLTEKDKLNSSTKAEIARLKAKYVIIIGKEGAVSKNAEDALKSVVPAENIERIGGADRYETSVKVAEKLGKTKEAALVYGNNYADALSIVPTAANKNMPVLLTKTNELPESVSNYAKANSANIDETYVIGGTGVVSSEVSSSFAAAATSTLKRIGGTDRYETNADIIEAFKEDFNFDNIYVVVGNGAKGNEFADALSVSPLAAKKMAPVVLTYKELDSKLETAIKSNIAPKKNVTAIGGEAVVPSSIVAKVESFSVPAVVFAADDAVKSKDDVTSSNVDIEGKNVTLKDAEVSGNVYIYGDGAKLSNVKVDGTVFVDPGENGSATLEGVTAASIKVRSGAANSIHLIDVKAGKLSVQSENTNSQVRVVAEGSTSVTYTVVSSGTILEGAGGSMGTVTIVTNGDGNRVVELRGKFTEPVVLEGVAEVKIAAGAVVSSIVLQAPASVNADPASTVAKVEINTLNAERIVLAGNLPKVEVKTAAALEVASGAQIGSIDVAKDAGSGVTVDVPKDAKVTQVTGDGAGSAKVTGDGASNVPVNSGTTTGGGGSSSGSGSGTEDNTKTITMKKGSTSVSKEFKAKDTDTIAAIFDNNIESDLVSTVFAAVTQTDVDTKVSNIQIDGKPLNVYVADILEAKGSTELASALNEDGKVNFTSLQTYVEKHSFAQLAELFDEATNGNVTLGKTVTINGKTVSKVVLTLGGVDHTVVPTDDRTITIADVKTLFNVSNIGNITLKQLLQYNFDLKIYENSNVIYEASGTNGSYTVQGTNTYTITIK